MPRDNRFRHQVYPTKPVLQPAFSQVSTEVAKGRDDFHRLHSELGIREVLLVHGTFMGDDPFGISEMLRSVGKSVPLLASGVNKLADTLEEKTRPFMSSVTGDVANFSEEFSGEFQKLVGDDPQVERMEPTWSSQNHHFARADLAVRLVCRLHDLQLAPDERVLLWGHSHAGNGFAILTNLLANHRESVQRFFQMAELNSTNAKELGEHWQRAKEILNAAASPHPLSQSVFIAAFGTPVRYGWDTGGCRRLLHVLHHKRTNERHPERTHPLFPPQLMTDIVTARYGDWVQAFAIAGSDVPSVTKAKLHAAMGEVLESGLPAPKHGLDTKLIFPKKIRNACARWKFGTRCHTDGRNLLLEYEPSGRKSKLLRPIEEAVLGHGVATTIDWLPTHLALVMDWLGREEAAG